MLGPVIRALRFRVRHRNGDSSWLLAPRTADPSPAVVDDARTRVLTVGRGGELEVNDRVPVATSYELADETLTVHVRSALDLTPYAPQLSSPDLDLPGTLERGDDGYVLTFALAGSSRQVDEHRLRIRAGHPLRFRHKSAPPET